MRLERREYIAATPTPVNRCSYLYFVATYTWLPRCKNTGLGVAVLPCGVFHRVFQREFYSSATLFKRSDKTNNEKSVNIMESSSNPCCLAGKVIIVTGGASGIGAGIAMVLAAAGATVVIVDINQQAIDRQVAEMSAAGFHAGSCVINLSSEDSIVQGCADIVAKYGTPWALVNNAGIQDRQTFLEGTVEEWDRMNAVNARGPFLMSREIAKTMVAEKAGGRIINVATNGLRGGIVHGLVAYVGSKGALAALSHATAFELAEHGITVNTVLPGGVATPGAISAKGPPPTGPGNRMPVLGMCDATDIGGAVLYFSLPIAGKVTDQIIAVDGGFSLT